MLSGDRRIIEALIDASSWQMLIPDVTVTYAHTIPPRTDIILVGSSDPLFLYEPSRQQITTDLGHIFSAIATISYIFEGVRQERAQYTIHGNLVSDGGKKNHCTYRWYIWHWQKYTLRLPTAVWLALAQ